jgi:hypothetical protein
VGIEILNIDELISPDSQVLHEVKQGDLGAMIYLGEHGLGGEKGRQSDAVNTFDEQSMRLCLAVDTAWPSTPAALWWRAAAGGRRFFLIEVPVWCSWRLFPDFLWDTANPRNVKEQKV